MKKNDEKSRERTHDNFVYTNLCERAGRTERNIVKVGRPLGRIGCLFIFFLVTKRWTEWPGEPYNFCICIPTRADTSGMCAETCSCCVGVSAKIADMLLSIGFSILFFLLSRFFRWLPVYSLYTWFFRCSVFRSNITLVSGLLVLAQSFIIVFDFISVVQVYVVWS